jgi:hypothetical protein
MNVKTELHNFYQHYGHDETIEAIKDLLETLACHCTDVGDNESRVPYDDAIEALEGIN